MIRLEIREKILTDFELACTNRKAKIAEADIAEVIMNLSAKELAFVLTNLMLYKEDYLDNFSSEEKVLLRNENNNEMIIFAIVTAPPGNAENATVNLLGPLAIDLQSRIGR